MPSRRNFLTTVGLAGGALGVGGVKLNALARAGARTSGLTRVEHYGGFVLLPDGTELPFEVRLPQREAPFLCGTGAERGGPEPNGRTLELSDAREAAGRSQMPLYAATAARSLKPSGARVIEYEDGAPFAVVLAYDSANLKTGEVSTNVTLSAFHDFARPVPLWEANPVEVGGPAIRLEKAPFLPNPGIMVRHGDGFIFHWLASDVYYTMAVENSASLAQARALVASLEIVAP